METVKVPGGEAVMLNDPEELTARRRRPIEIVSSLIGRKVQAMSTATRLVCGGSVVVDQSEEKNDDGSLKFPGGDVEVTEDELALVLRLNDVTALGLLKSWTLPRDLPTTEEEFTDLPVALYDSLVQHAARINAAMRDAGDPFSIDQVEDPASPTGD